MLYMIQNNNTYRNSASPEPVGMQVGTSMVIDLETPCCGLVRYGKSIFIGCMGNQVY